MTRVGQFETREVYVAAIHANVFDVFETGRRSRVWRALTQREAEAYIRGRTVGAGLP